MAAPVSSQSVEQTLDNFFGLDIGNEYETTSGGMITRWANPYLERINELATPHLSAIKAYIPAESLNFAVSSQSDYLNQDVTVIILSNLDLKNLLNSSSVCKLFYSAARADFIWRVQLCQFLPNVIVVAPDLCIYSSEQQYKVIFKRIKNECKPYIAKFDHYRELGDKWLNQLKTLESLQEADREEEGDSSQTIVEIPILRLILSHFFGPNYDGTNESIDPMSIQGRIMTAIKIMVPNAFNDQEKFESVIEKSVAALNTSSSNSDGPTIEDVTDVAETSEKNG